MQLTLKFLLLFLLLTGLTRGQVFEAEVESLFQTLESVATGFSSCVKVAKTHNKVASISEKDKKAAATLVNIYTQECPGNAPFYRTLNSELRSLNPKAPWDIAAYSLSKAIDLLGEANFDKVFSGKKRFDQFQNVQVGKVLKFNQFSSTSKNPTTALDFSCGKYFFEIQDANGFDCFSYSHFAGEDEVLLKPTAEFLVVDISQNSIEIQSKLKNLNVDWSSAEVYITLKMQRPTKKRSSDGQDATSINLDLEYIHGDAQTCTLTSGAAAINNKAVILLVLSALLFVFQ